MLLSEHPPDPNAVLWSEQKVGLFNGLAEVPPRTENESPWRIAHLLISWVVLGLKKAGV